MTQPVENRYLPIVRGPGHGSRAAERRKARLYLLPTTIAYTTLALALLAAALRSTHAGTALLCFAAGMACWTPLEYLAHRYVLHGNFPPSRNPLRGLLHRMFDDTHVEHHRKPWAAEHLSGSLSDTLPIAALWCLLALLAPWHTVLMFVSGLLLAYVIEEWIHYAVHFEDFTGRYWSYIRRHHMYHHSKIGSEVAYGLTNGIWDIVGLTRIPDAHRGRIHDRVAQQNGAEERS